MLEKFSITLSICTYIKEFFYNQRKYPALSFPPNQSQSYNCFLKYLSFLINQKVVIVRRLIPLVVILEISILDTKDFTQTEYLTFSFGREVTVQKNALFIDKPQLFVFIKETLEAKTSNEKWQLKINGSYIFFQSCKYQNSFMRELSIR